jgi:CRISPR/Cas system-associated exonuclease Cas4 (RecB family)
LVQTQKERRYSRYVPVRFTPSEKIPKHHRLQLAFDAFVLAVLGKASGRVPISGRIIHARRKKAFSIELKGLLREVESLVAKMRMALANGKPPDFVLIGHCSECEFEVRCRGNAVKDDNLQLAGRTQLQGNPKATESGYLYSHSAVLHIPCAQKI